MQSSKLQTQIKNIIEPSYSKVVLSLFLVLILFLIEVFCSPLHIDDFVGGGSEVSETCGVFSRLYYAFDVSNLFTFFRKIIFVYIIIILFYGIFLLIRRISTHVKSKS
ncbi:hypothetical protein A2714_04235 [Candidatus Woesebacteria bacterium RIFCSPHIGHO2_01_FULL_38_9]|uniref:Uncharacterized protein n=2 Tax=Candidatus Woeseibacteriota TaxID=1752722 RepID=A0A1F7XY11_9BACT|nr:MAG: hypothetical protein A2714_04235 [Candidatus Woesebacteria bacterium RIFCSPHIGHO2_01_FULL_38_9]OGM58976.1 MAG: hypothetical protein A3A75_00490 [Candidatus Woesebacteria bacterium RIFCSPLOWO2_01_FULL_39_10]